MLRVVAKNLTTYSAYDTDDNDLLIYIQFTEDWF